jgi:hypothetical protein
MLAFIIGMEQAEIAATLDLSLRTVGRDLCFLPGMVLGAVAGESRRGRCEWWRWVKRIRATLHSQSSLNRPFRFELV